MRRSPSAGDRLHVSVWPSVRREPRSSPVRIGRAGGRGMTRRRALFWSLLALLQLGALVLALLLANAYLDSRMDALVRKQLRIFEPERDPRAPDVLAVKPRFAQRWTTPEFSVDVRTNGDGYREDVDFRLEELDVAVLGDSFAFGHGVEAAERIGDVLRRSLPGGARRYARLPEWLRPCALLGLRRPAGPSSRRVSPWCCSSSATICTPTSTRRASRSTGTAGLASSFRCARTRRRASRSINRRRCVPRRAGSGGAARWAAGWSGASTRASGASPSSIRDRRGRAPNRPNPPALERGVLDDAARSSLRHLESLARVLRERAGEVVVLLVPERSHLAPRGEPSHPLVRAVLVECRGARARLRGSERELRFRCSHSGPLLRARPPLDARRPSPRGSRRAARGEEPAGRARVSGRRSAQRRTRKVWPGLEVERDELRSGLGDEELVEREPRPAEERRSSRILDDRDAAPRHAGRRAREAGGDGLVEVDVDVADGDRGVAARKLLLDHVRLHDLVGEAVGKGRQLVHQGVEPRAHHRGATPGAFPASGSPALARAAS